ncbi:MAG: T9SS type A sorting domain-containing protein, partial [Bacteroidetes bacterium]|nr:T9SS type A sorting domain-containing protein [Bacteroidota bacterium]
DVVDTALINDYYAGNGVDAITGIIAPMDPADGYQIHLGPFFLPPSSEIEYYSRYDLDLPNAFEINRFELNLGPTYSHHFILFKYQDGYENVTSNGFRLDAAHTYNEMVAVVQSSDTINLPNKTAFFWPQTTVLDLNTHMINYSTTKVLKAEVYINIYTQTTGIAKQIMYTDLVANTSISIPNDGNTHTFDKPVYTAGDFDEFFVWQLSSHTHKYGTDYDIYKRNGDGSKGGKLFDASHLGGDPNLAFIGYDYQEPPVLEFYPFFPIVPDAGFIHEASFVNTGPVPVAWGATSADEMMVMLYMYVEDTAGLTSGIKNIDIDKEEAVLVYPNPASDHVLFQVTHFRQGQFLILYDLLGREVIMRRFDSNTILLETGKLEDGIYIYKILSEDSFVDSGKLVIHRN